MERAGAAAAWVDTIKTFGSGKLTVAEVLEPAIRIAEEGCVSLYHILQKLKPYLN
jgi:gamma-glutamyltranspeptidase